MDTQEERPSLFGARVKQMRERRRLSRQELAELAHVAPNTLWRLERGRRQTTTIEVAARLAKALLVTLDYLAGIYDEHAEPETPKGAKGKRASA